MRSSRRAFSLSPLPFTHTPVSRIATVTPCPVMPWACSAAAPTRVGNLVSRPFVSSVITQAWGANSTEQPSANLTMIE